MTGSIAGYTSAFKFPLIVFDVATWHDQDSQRWRMLDGILETYLGNFNLDGTWEVSTLYTVTTRVVDPDNGRIYECLVEHTSRAIGSFAQDRADNPTYWSEVSFDIRARGEWQTGVSYRPGDIVYYDNQLAISLDNHQSGATFAGDVAANKWDIIVDFNPQLDLAQAWANNAEDVVVSGGLYSARHWAIKAEQLAQGGSDFFTPLTPEDNALAMFDASRPNGREIIASAVLGIEPTLAEIQGTDPVDDRKVITKRRLVEAVPVLSPNPIPIGGSILLPRSAALPDGFLFGGQAALKTQYPQAAVAFDGVLEFDATGANANVASAASTTSAEFCWPTQSPVTGRIIVPSETANQSRYSDDDGLTWIVFSTALGFTSQLAVWHDGAQFVIANGALVYTLTDAAPPVAASVGTTTGLSGTLYGGAYFKGAHYIFSSAGTFRSTNLVNWTQISSIPAYITTPVYVDDDILAWSAADRALFTMDGTTVRSSQVVGATLTQVGRFGDDIMIFGTFGGSSTFGRAPIQDADVVLVLEVAVSWGGAPVTVTTGRAKLPKNLILVGINGNETISTNPPLVNYLDLIADRAILSNANPGTLLTKQGTLISGGANAYTLARYPSKFNKETHFWLPTPVGSPNPNVNIAYRVE